MKISTEIGSAAKHVGLEQAVELTAKAGFDAWDFSIMAPWKYLPDTNMLSAADHPLNGPDYLGLARRLKQIGLDNGIECNQAHAPFPTSAKNARDCVLRALECCGEAGAQYCVIHPQNDASPEENARMYRELLPFAKACGVKIATENMYNWDKEKGVSIFAACATPESFCRHIDLVDDPYLVACLDVGHAEMLGSGTTAVEMIQALGRRLCCLHLHDNDKHRDKHQIPFSMDIYFHPIVKTLKKIGYQGYFTLEADRYLRDRDAQFVPQGLKDMARAARTLADWFEKEKN